MKVILGCPLEDGQTGVYLRNALEELGHTVPACINARIGKGPLAMLEAIQHHRPDFVLLTKDPSYKPILEAMSKKTIVVVWAFDPRTELAISDEFKHCHILYTNEADYLDKYREFGIKRVEWLSEGIDPTIHKRSMVTSQDIMRYNADVSFAGNILGIHVGRKELIARIAEEFNKFKVYSTVFNEEHNKMVQCSHVNIGHSGWPHISLSMSARDYRIMGAGGFLLTNHVKDIETWFEVGKMCDTYRTIDECIEKIKYYLEHDDERYEMAEYGYKVVHEKHKFSDRLRVMIQHVQEL